MAKLGGRNGDPGGRVQNFLGIQQIFEVCAKKTGYKGGERLRKPWW